jgi:hypothetical protein
VSQPNAQLPGTDNDKVTFGPSASNADLLDLLVTQGHFSTALGAFRAAATLALRKDSDLNTAPASAGTKWNRGSVTSRSVVGDQVLRDRRALNWGNYVIADRAGRARWSDRNAGCRNSCGVAV